MFFSKPITVASPLAISAEVSLRPIAGISADCAGATEMLSTGFSGEISQFTVTSVSVILTFSTVCKIGSNGGRSSVKALV
ncbi:hypothetical protein D3C87_847400 [compost metagenome]